MFGVQKKYYTLRKSLLLITHDSEQRILWPKSSKTYSKANSSKIAIHFVCVRVGFQSLKLCAPMWKLRIFRNCYFSLVLLFFFVWSYFHFRFISQMELKWCIIFFLELIGITWALAISAKNLILHLRYKILHYVLESIICLPLLFVRPIYFYTQ